MNRVISIRGLKKIYASGFKALDGIELDIHQGEIFALLGPNGAGKTTLIGAICGLVSPTEGTILVDGHDVVREFRPARAKIGLVPQEISTDMFETVWATMRFSRGLFGKAHHDGYLEEVLRTLSLWEKKNNKIMTLSGGMRRRVMIAKALSHEPTILFLDEPTAGVDVELRRDMWNLVRKLRERGVTIILTTHYIEEAEEMADRIGIINKGRIVLVEETKNLMQRLGKKELQLELRHALVEIPSSLQRYDLSLSSNGYRLKYTFDTHRDETGIAELLAALAAEGVEFKDLHSHQSSLEEIFVNLVHRSVAEPTSAAVLEAGSP